MYIVYDMYMYICKLILLYNCIYVSHQGKKLSRKVVYGFLKTKLHIHFSTCTYIIIMHLQYMYYIHVYICTFNRT